MTHSYILCVCPFYPLLHALPDATRKLITFHSCYPIARQDSFILLLTYNLDRLLEITCDLNPVQPQPWLCRFLRTSSFSQAAPPE
jgi:hypothetical protein